MKIELCNAKDELLDFVRKSKAIIKCAHINYLGVDIILKVGYSNKDYASFLKYLDSMYDNDFGHQKLFGVVWLSDGSWLDRDGYDGFECWKHRKLPDIPEECLD